MTGHLTADDLDDEPKRELSIPRVTVALLAVVAVLSLSAFAVQRAVTDSDGPELGATWFAPYVDATLTPISDFQDPGSNPARQTVLGFVVADGDDACAPSWGNAYSLDEAADELGLDRRVAQYRAQGGDPIVSFGGVANSELALACTDVDELARAYSSVVERYGQTTIDLDVEGASLADAAAAKRRGTALAAAQEQAAKDGRPFEVWLTLPVTTSGLQADAMGVVTETLEAGVDLAGVNVMTMSYGTGEEDMGEAVRSSLTATHDQLRRVYAKYGVADDAATTWNRLGATVMIGQNDTDGEVYTLDDAVRLVTEAREWELGRVSMWSLNRDDRCGGSYAVVGVRSNTCSGTDQAALGFSEVFTELTGVVPDVTVDDSATPTVSPTVVPDDPSTSPFPLWQPNRPYETGYQVVRHGNVYRAKWYTRGQDPAAQTADPSQNPWLVLGPVLPGEKPAPLPTVKAGTYPAWSPSRTYEAGDRVLYEGLPFEAKWYSAKVSPGAWETDPAASPWSPLFTPPGAPSTTPTPRG